MAPNELRQGHLLRSDATGAPILSLIGVKLAGGSEGAGHESRMGQPREVDAPDAVRVGANQSRGRS